MKRIDEKNAQMWGIAWVGDYPDAQNFMQLFYGPLSPSPNWSNYKNPRYDQLYEEAVRLPSGERQRELYREMQRMVVDDCVAVFRGRRILYLLDHAWFHNYKHNDIFRKYFKYCRADSSVRRERTQAWNQPVYWPVWAALGVAALVVGITLLTVRRSARGW
jgi:ABC-type transport system substrate-binding protein